MPGGHGPPLLSCGLLAEPCRAWGLALGVQPELKAASPGNCRTAGVGWGSADPVADVARHSRRMAAAACLVHSLAGILHSSMELLGRPGCRDDYPG